jgi:hypothetical protein
VIRRLFDYVTGDPMARSSSMIASASFSSDQRSTENRTLYAKCPVAGNFIESSFSTRLSLVWAFILP